MHVFQSKRHLSKNMLNLLFCEPSYLALDATFSLHTVLEQVTTICELSHQVDVAFVAKLLNKVDDVSTISAKLESFALWNSVLAFESLLFSLVDRFDHYKSAGEFVFCDHDWFHAALFDDSLKLVLVKLALETLLFQDSWQNFYSFSSAIEKESARLFGSYHKL